MVWVLQYSLAPYLQDTSATKTLSSFKLTTEIRLASNLGLQLKQARNAGVCHHTHFL